MTDRPIIFSGPMVRALIEGRKTMTRRLLKPQPVWHGAGDGLPGGWSWTPYSGNNDRHLLFGVYLSPDYGQTDAEAAAFMAQAAPYAIGDRLWVRETWSPDFEDHITGLSCVGYKADHKTEDGPWRPSIYMPRRLSRLTLTVTDVKVERLQEISEADAIAEGTIAWAEDPARNPLGASRLECDAPVHAFRVLWNTIHNGKPQHFWSVNPWIVALTFTVEQRNIDQ